MEALRVAAFRVPTEEPESDGTLEWDATPLVAVEAASGEAVGLGYTYAPEAAAHLIVQTLSEGVMGSDAMAPRAAWSRMVGRVRNQGRPGLASMAIAAVDTALWDLKARLLDLPLVRLLGGTGRGLPVYGSGGFTSYPVDRLRRQLAGWVEAGIGRVKMKVGRRPDRDVERVRTAREAAGEEVGLMVDANGAYDRKQALSMAPAFAELGVDWFEEPVPSDDLEGLRLLRDRAPPPLEVTAGEYGYDLFYFDRMLSAGAVDVLQVDITRCAGLTELLRVAALSRARGVPLSAHTAPALHLHPCSAVEGVRHVEWFHDHVRLEGELLDGAPRPERGELRPDLSRAGHGLRLRRDRAEPFRTFAAEAKP